MQGSEVLAVEGYFLKSPNMRRQRIGEKGVEKLLQITIEADKATRTITESSFEKIIVDTTVRPKNVQHLTDARQYRSRP